MISWSLAIPSQLSTPKKAASKSILYSGLQVWEGGALVDRTLEGEVMNLIHEGVGLEEKPLGLLHWTAYGKHLDIRVEEYDSFGETAYRLTLPKIKKEGT